MAKSSVNRTKNELPLRYVPAYRLVQFVARLSSIVGPEIREFVESEARDPDLKEHLDEIKNDLSLNSGREVFTQDVSVPASFLDAIEADKKLSELWSETETLGQVYSEFDVISSLNNFLLWLAVGLQFLNFRYGVEGTTKGKVKWEFGVGTSGVLVSIKHKFDDVASNVNQKVDGFQGSIKKMLPKKPVPAVEFPLDGFVNTSIHTESTARVGGLFVVDANADGKRISLLQKLASLYWDVNRAPAPNDGIPFTAVDLLSKKQSKLSPEIISQWPRGFRVTLGERFSDDGEVEPYVCVIAPFTIPGAKSKSIVNFKASRAGRLVQFIHEYLGDDSVDVWFARQSKSYSLETGSKTLVGDHPSHVRALVVNPDDEEQRWAVFPGHIVLHGADITKPLSKVCEESVNKPVKTEVRRGGASAIDTVGSIAATHLTDPWATSFSMNGCIDASFARLNSDGFRDGFGDYQKIANSIGVAYIDDWKGYQGRYVVTRDSSGNLRFGEVAGQNAVHYLEAPGARTILLTNTLLVKKAGLREFAEPGMSGSLVFLLPKDCSPQEPVNGEILLVGYICGGVKFDSKVKQNNEIFVSTADEPISNDICIQLLKPVWREFSNTRNLLRLGDNG